LSTLTTEAWQWLGRELDTWADTGQTANFWWRDDDATEPSTALGRLVGLSHDWDVPLALAVIPTGLKPELVDFLQDDSLTCVFQHGFAHANHATPGQRKLELGGTQTLEKSITDLQQGYQVLDEHFSDRFKPVLVPPWNRIDDRLVACLADIGFTGISTMKVCRNAYPAPGLRQVNTHLDPVNWRHQGGFIGAYPAIAILVQHLIAKRTGYRDRNEPTGILTHHLAQNEAVWRFLKDLLQLLSDHPAVTWLDASSIWATAKSPKETPVD
jgi:hypothetical protein